MPTGGTMPRVLTLEERPTRPLSRQEHRTIQHLIELRQHAVEPQPAPVKAPWRQIKYPFRDMKVGEDRFIPDKTIPQLSGSLRHVRDLKGYLFRCRTEGSGVRVWRTY